MKIAYICDRKRCEYCDEICNHTTDIEHAVNFRKVEDGVWFEREETEDEGVVEEKSELD